MRSILFTLTFVLATSLSLAFDITTREGTTYKQCVVTNVEPDGICISYPDGAAKIPFIDLPESLQKEYHYDAAKVTEYRKKVASLQALAAKKLEAERQQLEQKTLKEAYTHAPKFTKLADLSDYVTVAGPLLERRQNVRPAEPRDGDDERKAEFFAIARVQYREACEFLRTALIEPC